MTAKLVVMVSGSGSNLQAIMDAIAKNELDAEIVLVVSNRKSAYGLVRAKEAKVPTLYFPFKPYRDVDKTRAAYDDDLATKIRGYHPNLIVLAGWMHIFSAAFLDHFPNQVINLHPALPATIVGKDAIVGTFEAYRCGDIKNGGCMVHYVIPEVDAGEVIIQESVSILPDDKLEDFEARLHIAEHRIIVEAVRRIID